MKRDNCKNVYENDSQVSERHFVLFPFVRLANTNDVFSTDSRQQANTFHNNHTGFVLGWVILIGSTVVTIVYLFYMYTGIAGEAGVMETVAYGWDIAIKVRVC